MKYIVIKYIALAAVLFSFSCKKFIEIDPPKTSLVNETVFQTNDQAKSAVTGIYSTIRGGFAGGSISGISACAGFSSDELIAYVPRDLPFNENQLTPQILSTGAPQELYSGPYKAIFTANTILEGLSASDKLTPSVKTQLEGEALFIRAFSYFYLVNLFGEVPLQLSSDYRVTTIASRAKVEQIYQQVVADLISAEGKLSEAYTGTGRVRPNKSAAQALLARTYLYLKDWINAEKYASLVLAKTDTYGLTDFDAVFLANSKEAIWQLEPVPNSNAPEGLFFIPGSFLVPPGTAALRSSFAQSGFEIGDKRKDAWVKSYTLNSITYFYPFKYKVRMATTATEYSMVMRLAEQYLIRSEARLNLDKIGLAIGDLNMVRQRSLPNGTNANPIAALSTTLDKASALLAVEQERKVELFSEWGHRWFDLKRTGRATAVLGPLKPFWQPTDVLYPVPQIERDRNVNISQNEGY